MDRQPSHGADAATKAHDHPVCVITWPNELEATWLGRSVGEGLLPGGCAVDAGTSKVPAPANSSTSRTRRCRGAAPELYEPITPRVCSDAPNVAFIGPATYNLWRRGAGQPRHALLSLLVRGDRIRLRVTPHERRCRARGVPARPVRRDVRGGRRVPCAPSALPTECSTELFRWHGGRSGDGSANPRASATPQVKEGRGRPERACVIVVKQKLQRVLPCGHPSDWIGTPRRDRVGGSFGGGSAPLLGGWPAAVLARHVTRIAHSSREYEVIDAPHVHSGAADRGDGACSSTVLFRIRETLHDGMRAPSVPSGSASWGAVRRPGHRRLLGWPHIRFEGVTCASRH